MHSGTAYIDGAVHNNCPVFIADNERRRIWDDVSDWPADILLSLGTAHGDLEPKTQTLSMPTEREDHRSLESMARQKSLSGIRYGLRLAFKIIDNQLNCDRIWGEYVKKATNQQEHRLEDRRRNMRIYVRFDGERPRLDAVDELQAMEQHSLLKIRKDPDVRADIHEVAHRLIASCFYFEVSSTNSDTNGSAGYTCKGKYHLRILPVKMPLMTGS